MKKMILVLLIWLSSSNTVYAKDLGRYGSVFDIAEEDFLSMIENKLKLYEANGRLEKFQNDYSEKLKNQIIRPNRVIGITKTKENKIRKFDPTIELEEEILIPIEEGTTISYNKGTKINPLDYQIFDEKMIFIDGDDAYQKAFANKYLDSNPNTSIILVNGKPGPETINDKEYFYYFDQWGVYSKRFQITVVPSVIYQKSGERLLTIEEVKPDEEANA
jgi:conjugal transfer pilus assembly protein TraW